MKQEYLIRLGMLQQEAERLGQENEAINKQIMELSELKKNLNDFLSAKNKDALVSLGKGIFSKAELKDKELYVNIGAGVVVKKNVPDTIKIIDEQVLKLEEAKENLMREMESLNLQVQETLARQEAEKE